MMDKIIEFINKLNTTHIALLSVAVTVLLFVLGKRKENQLKIYETKKEQYAKLLDFYKKLFSKSSNAKDLAKSLSKEDFYELGSSLAVYGSRKMYRKYCFWRELTVNEHWQSQKYYSNDMMIFIIGEMYQIMRKEIGLNKGLQRFDVPNMLLFMLNDITKPEYRSVFSKMEM